MKSRKTIIASLDIGTSKVLCLIAAVDANGGMTIIGAGHQKSLGIENGNLVDIQAVKGALISAVSIAEKMSGYNLDQVVVSMAGKNLHSSIKKVSVDIPSGMIKNNDVNNIADHIYIEFKRNGRQLIHLFPIKYVIDDVLEVKNPNMMCGKRLTAEFQVISTSLPTITNFGNCFKKCQLVARNYVAEAYASALATINNDERELGALLIDIGAGDTTFAIFSQGTFVNIGWLPLGGNNISKDLAAILAVSMEKAEILKIKNANLSMSYEEENELIDIDIDGDEDFKIATTKKRELNDVIRYRLEEILDFVNEFLTRKKLDTLIGSGGIILTGGTSSIPGIDVFVSEKMHRTTRIGYITNINEGRHILKNSDYYDPSFSAAVGMLLFAKSQIMREDTDINFSTEHKGFFGKIAGFFSNL